MARLAEELDKLRVLVAVADKGKINEAAETLHLTQPSVSRSIQKLEEAYGAEIFVRGRDGVKLTRAGALLYERAARLMRELEDIQARARHVGDELNGHLTVGTYESLAEYLWPDFLLKLERLHPSFQLSVKTGLHRNPWEELEAGTIDLLVDAEPQTKASMVSWPLYHDKFAFYTSPQLKLRELTPALAETVSVIFVQKALDENRVSIAEHLERAGYRFARQYCFDSFSTAKRMAIMGTGVAVLPKRLAEDDVKRKQIRPLSLTGFPADGFGRHTICATVAAENRRDPRLKKLIDLLRGHFK